MHTPGRQTVADSETTGLGRLITFQDRQAYVVFFSTAASSMEDAPREISFVFDRRRFNVAISRVRAPAVMVGSPALVHHRTSAEDIRIANGRCRFIEESKRLGDDRDSRGERHSSIG